MKYVMNTAGRNWVYMALRDWDWKGNDTPGLAFKLSHISGFVDESMLLFALYGMKCSVTTAVQQKTCADHL
jgi:hypothetical protein